MRIISLTTVYPFTRPDNMVLSMLACRRNEASLADFQPLANRPQQAEAISAGRKTTRNTSQL